jgi:hypothetical protein
MSTLFNYDFSSTSRFSHSQSVSYAVTYTADLERFIAVTTQKKEEIHNSFTELVDLIAKSETQLRKCNQIADQLLKQIETVYRCKPHSDELYSVSSIYKKLLTQKNRLFNLLHLLNMQLIHN